METLEIKSHLNYVANHVGSGLVQAKNGSLAAGKKVAHGALSVLAESADFAGKAVLLTGPCVGAFLTGDSIAYGTGNFTSIWSQMNPCNDRRPFLANISALTTDANLSEKCKTSNTAPLAAMQQIMGLGILLATPVTFLVCRKINKLANQLNQSF